MQLRVVGIGGTALAHGHVMGRIEGAGADIADGAGKTGLAVDGIGAAQSIAVVLHQPEGMLVAEFLHRLQIKGIPQRMCDHDRLGLR